MSSHPNHQYLCELSMRTIIDEPNMGNVRVQLLKVAPPTFLIIAKDPNDEFDPTKLLMRPDEPDNMVDRDLEHGNMSPTEYATYLETKRFKG